MSFCFLFFLLVYLSYEGDSIKVVWFSDDEVIDNLRDIENKQQIRRRRRVVYQGSRLQGQKKSGVEKYATDTIIEFNTHETYRTHEMHEKISSNLLNGFDWLID